jgi:hypothetical protein
LRRVVEQIREQSRQAPRPAAPPANQSTTAPCHHRPHDARGLRAQRERADLAARNVTWYDSAPYTHRTQQRHRRRQSSVNIVNVNGTMRQDSHRLHGGHGSFVDRPQADRSASPVAACGPRTTTPGCATRRRRTEPARNR